MTSKSLSGFTLLSTHEPCPMCFVACIWAEISAVVYGASIKETIKLGRKRILITSEELTKKAPYKIEVIGGKWIQEGKEAVREIKENTKTVKVEKKIKEKTKTVKQEIAKAEEKRKKDE